MPTAEEGIASNPIVRNIAVLSLLALKGRTLSGRGGGCLVLVVLHHLCYLGLGEVRAIFEKMTGRSFGLDKPRATRALKLVLKICELTGASG